MQRKICHSCSKKKALGKLVRSCCRPPSSCLSQSFDTFSQCKMWISTICVLSDSLLRTVCLTSVAIYVLQKKDSGYLWGLEEAQPLAAITFQTGMSPHITLCQNTVIHEERTRSSVWKSLARAEPRFSFKSNINTCGGSLL